MSVKEILNKELNTLKSDIKDRHIKEGQRVTGKTIGTLRTETQDMSGQLLGAEYIGVLEKGRKGGKVPSDFKKKLVEWAKAKGITFGSQTELNRFAYFLSKRIQKEGTLTNKHNKDIFTTPIDEFTKRLLKEISAFYVSEIKNIIYDTK
jgi:hypothetical protein